MTVSGEVSTCPRCHGEFEFETIGGGGQFDLDAWRRTPPPAPVPVLLCVVCNLVVADPPIAA